MSVECPECGCTPMGDGCYHICPNSSAYYSPERERADDVHYGDDDVRERYANERDDADWENVTTLRGFHDDDSPMDHGAGGGDPDDGYW